VIARHTSLRPPCDDSYNSLKPWRPGGREQQQENIMSDTTFVPGFAAPPIPLREVLPWAIFAALALLAIYFVGAEEGATSLINGMYVHEFVHDGRHLLGFPCH
jgi:Probable cobalt transporter subunit (CbtB)